MDFALIEKPVPEFATPGLPDPRVLSLWLQARDNPRKPAEGIEEVRASMGWPNLDLTHGTVETSVMDIPGRAGTVRVIRNVPLKPATSGPLPAIVYFHGGGFMGGSTRTVQNPCRYLAQQAGAAVFNVDYRLAPEHPFPAPLDDCHDALVWIHDNAARLGLDPRRIAVAGDSAGGNLAAACSVRDSMEGAGRIAAQLLVYPVVDLRPEDEGHLAWSIEDYRISAWEELVLPSIHGLRMAAPWFAGLYLNGTAPTGASPDQALASPIMHDPSRFPPTLVITAEYDCLRTEGEEFARRIALAGGRARALRYRGMDHAFLDRLGLCPQAADALNEMAQFMSERGG